MGFHGLATESAFVLARITVTANEFLMVGGLQMPDELHHLFSLPQVFVSFDRARHGVPIDSNALFHAAMVGIEELFTTV